MLRVAAAEALGKIGDDSPSVIDALVKALSDSNGTVTVRAANALSQIGAPGVPALVKMLSNEDYRKLVVEVIGEMGENAESAVPTARIAHDDDVTDCRLQVVQRRSLLCVRVETGCSPEHRRRLASTLCLR